MVEMITDSGTLLFTIATTLSLVSGFGACWASEMEASAAEKPSQMRNLRANSLIVFLRSRVRGNCAQAAEFELLLLVFIARHPARGLSQS